MPRATITATKDRIKQIEESELFLCTTLIPAWEQVGDVEAANRDRARLEELGRIKEKHEKILADLEAGVI